ncbi:MAG: hypothetical protein J6L00_02715 [Clostridia bacterium]|nr:hypothetical protein [Clostridia bacterium]
MPKENITVPVEELIRQYNDELLAMKKKHDAQAASSSIPTMAQLDAQFPLPDVTEDLQQMRQDTSQNVSAVEAENNAVDEENRGQTDAPPVAPPTTLPPFPLYDVDGEILPPSAPPPQEMSLGYLKAFVTTARGALPVANAQVIVTRLIDDDELLEQVARTDVSGYSPLFSLPAVSGIYSQSPENMVPFTYYNMYVRADGFYPILLREIPMYGGITAVQPVDLIPITEGDNSNRETVITEGAPEVSKNTQQRGAMNDR